ncbi:hypothetical protein HOP50_03g20390 [Chloropicon primus]|uniref:Uncharacterized protein n=1 Tax=Chloropicon primus TaxID=1764295 RepID=A0A5B8MGQ4_9CHLO|nr:hypothetical protein A3770_03p20390 [Chloropicon primus]UPQ98733.1 hypothetical protein HOP50_03g20390 [Chloropicon primus]|eukprot:QDZ19521.1 hypothetical protein A3770_03p20390 [Chloropicon primus]
MLVPVELSEVLEAFGPEEKKVWDNTMLHPSITCVISELVVQVRNQNKVINELVASRNEGSGEGNGFGVTKGGGRNPQKTSVQDKVRSIEDRLAVVPRDYEMEAAVVEEAPMSVSKVHDRIFQRLEALEAQAPNLVDVSMLEEHKRKTKLALKRYHEKQASLERTCSDASRAEIAKMAAEVLSVASSTTESISESICADYEHMVKSLNLLRGDLDFLVEKLYGKQSGTPSKSAKVSVVVSPSKSKKDKEGKKSSAEEISRRLRSSVSAGSSKGGEGSLIHSTNSLHDKMKSVLELLDRQQERTAEVEEKARASEKALLDHQERILRVETTTPVSSSPSRANSMNLYDNEADGAEEEGKILKLQVKDINSRLDGLASQVEDTHAMLKKPTSAKALAQKMAKMEERMEALKKDQESARKKAALSEDRFRKLTSEKIRTLSGQVTRNMETNKAVVSKMDDLSADCKAKLRQCKTEVSNMRKQASDRPGVREMSFGEAVSKIRSLESKLEDIKSSLESNKKWNAKVMTEKIKRLSDQATKQSELIQSVSAELSKLDDKYKENIDSLSKKTLSKSQGKSFISGEVKVLREYIESRWKEIADQLKESIQVTKESIKITKGLPNSNVVSPGARLQDDGRYEGLLDLLQELQNDIASHSESHRELAARLFRLEEKFESVKESALSQGSAVAVESEMASWKDSMTRQYGELARQIDGYVEDSKAGLKAAAAIEDRLESLVDFLGEKLPGNKASEEVEEKLMSFHRTVLKMANFDEICITEISKLSNRVQNLESVESVRGDPAEADETFEDKLNTKMDYHQALDLLKELKTHFDEALSHKLDVKVFLAHSATKSPYKHSSSR